MPLLAGIDVGTTEVKAALFDETGRLVTSGSAPSGPIRRPQPSYAEQDPDQWWRAVATALRQATAAAPRSMGAVVAVGVVGQFSQVIVGYDGRLRGPAISWQDGRAVEEGAVLAAVGPDVMAARLGARLPSGASTPAAVASWIVAHEPGRLLDGGMILQAKDWINLRLTGSLRTDRASGLWLVNQKTGVLDPGHARLLGISDDHLPPRVEPYEVVGQVTRSAAQETGLPIGIPVVCGWIDALAGILGSGCVAADQAFDLAGTAEVAGVLAARVDRPAPGLLEIPYAGLSLVYGLTNAGADSSAWAVEALYPELSGDDAYAMLDQDALRATSRIASGSPVFLPFLSGERSPVWDPTIRAAWVGIDRMHRRADLARGVLIGLALTVAHLLNVAREATAARPRSLRVSGGGNRLRAATILKAAATGLPIERLGIEPVSALGAAILAGVGGSVYPNQEAAARAMVTVVERLEPDPALTVEMADAYDRYRAALEAVAGMSQLSHKHRP